jgi:hypothetical protein
MEVPFLGDLQWLEYQPASSSANSVGYAESLTVKR